MSLSNKFNKPITLAKDIEGVKRSAFWHLGRRDHSEHELRHKLSRKTTNQDWIDAVINDCFSYGYLDDQRFTKNFIRSSQNKGFGITRIKRDLQLKGISSTQVANALCDDQYDYINSALTLLKLKYTSSIANQHLKQKAMAFLQGKGHQFDDIFAAIDIHLQLYPEDKLSTISNAILLLNKKFKNVFIVQKTKDKALRFLTSRGYSFNDTLTAIEQYNEQIDDDH